MNAQEALETIGKLIVSGRLELGIAQQPFAKHAGLSYTTLRSMESGQRVPWDTNQRKIENALGWRPGAIQEILDNAETIPMESLTLDYLREGAGEPTWQDLDAEESETTRPVTRAGELSNEELIGELAYRLRNKTIHPGAQK